MLMYQFQGLAAMSIPRITRRAIHSTSRIDFITSARNSSALHLSHSSRIPNNVQSTAVFTRTYANSTKRRPQRKQAETAPTQPQEPAPIETTKDMSPHDSVVVVAPNAEAIPKKTIDLNPLELMDLVKQFGKEGKRIGINDENGEQQVLAVIPDDVRTYNWRSAEWTWGVLERLFQDCEQAKIKFKIEDYVNEEGKTKKRVVSDADGQHIGEAKGWWFDGMCIICQSTHRD
jgi:hypothetical protein